MHDCSQPTDATKSIVTLSARLQRAVFCLRRCTCFQGSFVAAGGRISEMIPSTLMVEASYGAAELKKSQPAAANRPIGSANYDSPVALQALSGIPSSGFIAATPALRAGSLSPPKRCRRSGSCDLR